MIYLILAVASSALVSTVMRFSEKQVKNNMGMFMANYAVCLCLSRLFMGENRLFTAESGIGFAVFLGLFSGILYLAGFVLLQKNMMKNGMALASTFMKLGVLVPTIMAIVVYRERPSVVQILGILLSLCAIIVINFEKNGGGTGTAGWMLIVLLLVSGVSDAMANVYDKNGNVLLKDHYLFYTFFAALLCAAVLAVKKRRKIRATDLLFGVLIGIPNYFSARFLLLALGSVPAVITYPVCNVATIVVISLISVLSFKETLSRKKRMALGMILAAMVLLNV